MTIAGPIDVADAVAILNHFRHDACDNWYIRGECVDQGPGGDCYVHLSEFEAISIAEKYLRDHPINFRILSWERTHSESDTNVTAVLHINLVV
jgi:hypothetical protein